MIGIDWGTSSFRAYRFGPDGAVLERRETEQGILEVPEGQFPVVLRREIGPWLEAGESLVLLCGMVGSRQGWREAPYLPCPAGLAEIAATLTHLPFEGARCLLVPGLTARDAAGVPDVMRGEETKLVALLERLGPAESLVCLPGTHSKWVRVGRGRVLSFTTHMTGETRAVLLEHSILGRMAAPDGAGDAAFARGVARGGEPGRLLHHLFGTRTQGLMGDLAPAETESYLSGLLIGHEIRAALAGAAAKGPVQLMASEALLAAYGRAFDLLGIPHQDHDPDMAAHGLVLIGRTLR